MWTIIELISKNPEISLASRNNPEMSQRSSDVPMLVNISIYIFPCDMGQNDTIGKIELIPFFVLSENMTNC